MTEVRPPRVALVLGSSTGGVGRHVASVAAGLPARGWAVTVLGPAATDSLFGFAAAGARFLPVEIEAGLRPVPTVRALRDLRAALTAVEEPVDVVHAHGLRAGLIAAAAHPAGLPLVVTWHNTPPPAAPPGSWLLERQVARRADVTLAASHDLLARALRLGAGDVRPHAVAAPTRPAPARSRAEVRTELGVAEGQPLLLAVARLHPQKGLDVLLAAAERWGDRRPPPVVAVAGGGPLAAQLRADAERCPVPVRLLGPRDDVADLLAAADLVVLPSRWEARALVAQEALRAGRPLVATSVGGLPDLLGDGARLVPPDDPEALAQAVGALLDDPAGLAAMAERGRARAAGWPTEDDTARHLVAIYRELTGRAAGAGLGGTAGG